MARTVRYCIQCGHEIGDEPCCTNPDCHRIPNFYLNVPGPGPHFSRLAERSTVTHRAGEAAQAPSDARGAFLQAPEPPPRQTLPLQAVPVAVLHGTGHIHGRYPIHPGITEIGARSASRIVIDRPEVSSRHARIICREESGRWALVVEDSGSTNGTYVNDEPVTSHSLRDRDRVRFARYEFEVRFVVTDEPRVTLAM